MWRFEGGFLTFGRVAGVPIRAHWSTPLGALLAGALKFRPVAWALFAVIILAHELAHAAAARAFRLEVYSADLMPFGGQCVHELPPSEKARSLIAAAGPATNALLCAASLLALRLGGAAMPPRLHSIVDTFAMANFFVTLVNLLPIPPLDGALAWKLPGMAIAAGWNRAADGLGGAARHVESRRRSRRVASGHLRAVGREDEAAAERDEPERPTLH